MTLPLLLGHRGARAFRHVPENTLASFELCLQQGCNGFEFDVRLSGDGQALICHDASFDGVDIARTPAQNLPLPMLAHVLGRFAARAFLDIELKVAGLESALLAELRAHPPYNGFVVSSFFPGVLAAIRARDPEVPLGLICETSEQLLGWYAFPGEWVITHFKLVDRELIDAIHVAGKKIMIWTVNRPALMREFANSGVEAIISDETELMARTLRNSSEI
jgi:glycerophosphoryl diester phosphodiesterase